MDKLAYHYNKKKLPAKTEGKYLYYYPCDDIENATVQMGGRGAQVVENELISLLENRPDLTAILDVTEPEPVSPSNKLLSLNNVVLTPHIAGSQGAKVNRMAEYMYDEFLRYIRHETPLYEVSLESLKTMA